MYLTYIEYIDMGGCIDSAHFPRFEAKARRVIDIATMNRLVGESPVRDSVKHCMYDLVNAIRADESTAGASGREIASMSNDGVSVTYATGNGQRSAYTRYSAIVREWLLGETDACGVPLLFAGVSV